MKPKKVTYLTYTVKDDIEESHSIEDIFDEIFKRDLAFRDHKLPKKEDLVLRLHKWEKKGDYYAGTMVQYSESKITAGNSATPNIEQYSLPDGKRVVNVTLFLYFPADKTFSVIYNHTGARYSAILTYLNVMQGKLGYHPVVYLKPKLLMHPDIQQLISENPVSLATFAVARDKVPTLKDKSSLHAAFTSLEAITANESMYEITIKKIPYSKSSDNVLRSSNQKFFDLAGVKDIGEMRDMYEKVSVKIENEIVNVLQENYDSTIEVKDYSDPDTHADVLVAMYRNYTDEDNYKIILKALTSAAD